MTEMEFFDTTSSTTQFKHPMTLFELTGFPKEELGDVSDVNAILESICLIRKHIKGDSTNIKIMVHDPDGGVSGAACVIVLYGLLQCVDESINENNEVKKSATDVEVFQEVNKLRHVRANMIDKYENYKMLYQCLSWYGQNKALFDQLKPKNQAASRQRPNDDVVTNTTPAINTIVNNSRRDNFEDDIYFTGHTYVN